MKRRRDGGDGDRPLPRADGCSQRGGLMAFVVGLRCSGLEADKGIASRVDNGRSHPTATGALRPVRFWNHHFAALGITEADDCFQ